MPHRGVVNYLAHATGYLEGHHRGAVMGTPLSFDATVTTLFAPLLTGRCLVVLPSEAGARDLRYEFFRQALHGNLDRIATAHTLDDQAETVLMKLARGAGTRGLAGIYPEVSIQHSALSAQPRPKAVVRPLLEIRRERLTDYLAELGQTWREDSSNRDLRHTRSA